MREEAIKSALKFLVLKQKEQGSWGYADNDNINKVPWDEALEWIDQQPCGDCISRQAVLDALMEKDKRLRNINWYDKPYAEGECRGIDEALSIISNLPSVTPQPEKRTEERTKTHACVCISREAAIDAIWKPIIKPNEMIFDALKQAQQNEIETLPSVEPERKPGKWFLLDECANEGWYCDQCHKKVFKADFSNTMRKYKFCPNCGAKMEVDG